VLRCHSRALAVTVARRLGQVNAGLYYRESALQAHLRLDPPRLQGHSLHASIRELTAAEREARSQLDLVAVEADELRLQVRPATRHASGIHQTG
jgi:hypothetical protein